jgi:hypothetical protein
MVRRVAGLDKRDSTSSGPTSEYEDGVMQGGLPREAIPKDILLLLALWGVMMVSFGDGQWFGGHRPAGY